MVCCLCDWLFEVSLQLLFSDEWLFSRKLKKKQKLLFLVQQLSFERKLFEDGVSTFIPERVLWRNTVVLAQCLLLLRLSLYFIFLENERHYTRSCLQDAE